MQPQRSRPDYAAIDLGTNNCRLLVAHPARGGFTVTDSYSRIVRLGEGLHATGRLAPAAMDRALHSLHACAARLARRPPATLRAVATEACRRAANAPAFLARVTAETGLRIEVISPREEVALAIDGCAPLLAGPGRRALLFDIGGGSTELAWLRLEPGRPPAIIGLTSLPVGVVTMAERFGPAASTAAGFAAMVADVAARLAPFEATHRITEEMRRGGVLALGTSGTVTTLAGVALDLPRYRRLLVDGVTLGADDAARALRIMLALGPDGLAAHPCVGADRAAFVLPGCAIFAAIQARWAAPEIIVADRGLREGILLRLMRAPALRAAVPA